MIPCAFMFAGCGEGNPSSVMTLSVNPKVSFVLDANNKVLSVNLGNDDAGIIYADVNFVGQDVDSTIKLFIERAAISGHASLDDANVTVEISGNAQATVDDLKQKVESKIKSTYEELGIQARVTFDKISEEAQKQALIAKAKILAPEKTNSEIEAMSNTELVKLINDKQKEYKDLAYSQIQEISGKIDSAVTDALNTAKTVLDEALTRLDYYKAQLEQLPSVSELISDLEETIKETYQPAFDNAVKAFQDAKNEAIATAKAEYETVKQNLINTYKTQVNSAKANVLTRLEEQKTAGNITQEQYDAWVSLINSYSPTANN